MENTVFDILVYVFDRYLLEELPESTERDAIVADLTGAGFEEAHVARALDWLADLADVRVEAGLEAGDHSYRIYCDHELERLDADCRGLLLALERGGVLSPGQREIVIDRLLALESEELDLEQVKWVVLMVLSSQSSDLPLHPALEDLMPIAPVAVPN
jgi:Smg protein